MQRQTQLAILQRLLDHVEHDTTVDARSIRSNSASVYVDGAVLAAERAGIFRTGPIVAGFGGDLPDPGSFKTLEVAGIPLLIVRGRDGTVRAFRNMCRHRGARVAAEPEGNRQLFTCPFHAWAYDASGHLVRVPREECFGEVDKSGNGLAPVAACERHGILWVQIEGNIDDDALAFGIAPELDALNLGGPTKLGTKTMDANINWKLAVDTFGETYHFETLHRGTVSNYFHSNVHAYDTFGPNHRMVFAGKQIAALKASPQEQWSYRSNTLTAYYLFPNTQIIVMPHHIDLFQIFPDARDPARSRTLYSYYPTSPQAQGMTHEQAFELTAFVIRQEDYAAAETAQANFCGNPDATIMFGRNEPALHHYHAQYRARLGRKATETAPA